MCKAYLFHTTSIFNFVQMPVADKYTDILYMRTLLFPPIFHGKSVTLCRGWRGVYIFSICTYPWQKTIHGVPTWIKQEVVNLGARNYVTNSWFLKTEKSKSNVPVLCTIETNVAWIQDWTKTFHILVSLRIPFFLFI